MSGIELDQFIKDLASTISREDLDIISSKPEDFDEEDYQNYISDLNSTFFPQKRNRQSQYFGDLLLDFIYNYDVEGFEIKSVFLNSEEDVDFSESYIFIGRNEGGEIIIDRNNHSIKLIDSDGNILCKCAKNGKDFLYRLLSIEKISQDELTLTQKEEYLTNEFAIKDKDEFAFWLTLLGTWDD